MSILVILESGNKVSKVQQYLGPKYVVTASGGHIRDLPSKQLSIDVNNDFKPNYEISVTKKQIVNNIKLKYKKLGKNGKVLMACDYDREGESISWHLCEMLHLKRDNRKRLLFTEITKSAILKSVENVKELDMNMVNSQQARRILDRLIGYTITPILWKHIQSSYKKDNSLSAGRVQSVVLKLVLDREKDIQEFNSKSSYKVNGVFSNILDANSNLGADLNYEFNSKDKTREILELCKKSEFRISEIKNKKSIRKSKAPFITSSLQQEASNKFKMSPKLTMKVAQTLFEEGFITYIRTDSVILSEDAKNSIKDFVKENFGNNYYSNKTYKNKCANCQEAHEAIRPCDFTKIDILGNNIGDNEMKLYKLIWERTIASQMTDAEININTNIIKGNQLPDKYHFTNKNEEVLFDGFLKVYKPFDENKVEENKDLCKDLQNKEKSKEKLKVNMKLDYFKINGLEKYSKPSFLRFTEASLIKKLDDLGIGRPSTYSNMVSIIQDRKYVEKRDIDGIVKYCNLLELINSCDIKETTIETKIGNEKQKLIPTDIGEIVNTFMIANFPSIIDYKYTSIIETELDKIARGELDWIIFLKNIYKDFHSNSQLLMKDKELEKNKYKRNLGLYPGTKYEVVCYIGKYGPLVQYKDKFSPLGEIKIEDVTLEQAIQLLKYPNNLGKYKDKEIIVKNGKYGLYFTYNNSNYSISSKDDILLDEAINIIKRKNENSSINQNNIIKQINDKIIIKNGKFGPYISYNNNTKNINIKLYKNPNEITEQECLELISKKLSKSK